MRSSASLWVLGLFPVDDKDFTKMLDRQRRKTRADGAKHRFALFARLAGYPDLDQLVAFQVEVDLVQHRVGQALVADHDDRMQAVCTGFESLTLGCSQVACHGIPLRRRFY